MGFSVQQQHIYTSLLIMCTLCETQLQRYVHTCDKQTYKWHIGICVGTVHVCVGALQPEYYCLRMHHLYTLLMFMCMCGWSVKWGFIWVVLSCRSKLMLGTDKGLFRQRCPLWAKTSLNFCKTIHRGPSEHERTTMSQTERNKVAPDLLTRARSHFCTLRTRSELGRQRIKKGW